MTEEICDPFGGWGGIGHVWAHCRGMEEACVEVELLGISSTHALVKILPSWTSARTAEIAPGSYEEYNENGTVWRVYCNGVSLSQMLANIYICYEEAAIIPCSDHETQADCEAAGCYWHSGACHSEPSGEGMKVGDTKTVGIMSFKLTSIVCTPVQQITAWAEGVSNTIKLGAWGVFPGPFIMGGLFVLFESVNAACDEIIEKASEGGLTPEDVEEIDTLLESEYTRPDGSKPTPEEIHDVKMKVVNGFDYTDPAFVEMVEKLLAGTISKEEFLTWLKQYTIDNTKIELDTVYYTANFTLEIPTFVMAGEVKVSGTAPKQNTDIQIMAVKKFFGFDWLASDTELATVTSDANYQYEAILNLDEFGIIEVYARIPKEWWEILDEDIETPHHTVFVMTWGVILVLVVAAALIYDKSSGGKLQKMLKGKKR